MNKAFGFWLCVISFWVIIPIGLMHYWIGSAKPWLLDWGCLSLFAGVIFSIAAHLEGKCPDIPVLQLNRDVAHQIIKHERRLSQPDEKVIHEMALHAALLDVEIARYLLQHNELGKGVDRLLDAGQVILDEAA
jgi:hypothetical protein